MRTYKLYIRLGQTVADAAYTFNEDGSMTSFIFDPANRDYQEFVQWCEQGNTPEPADIVSQVENEVDNAV